MSKTSRIKLKTNSVDFVEKKIDKSDFFKKENIKNYIKVNWKYMVFFLTFFVIFLFGIILTSIGLSTTSPKDLGQVNLDSTIASIGIIFLTISSLVIIILIPIFYRIFSKFFKSRRIN